MDPKGYEIKPWFPYMKSLYEQIEEDMMAVDAKGYEEKPWWPYVLDLQEKIDSGGGGSSDFTTATVTLNITTESGMSWSIAGHSRTETTLVMPPDLPAGYFTQDGEYQYVVEKSLIGSTPVFNVVLSNLQDILNESFLMIDISSDYDHDSTTLTGQNTTLSGDIVWDADGELFIVSGDCTITAHIDDVN